MIRWDSNYIRNSLKVNYFIILLDYFQELNVDRANSYRSLLILTNINNCIVNYGKDITSEWFTLISVFLSGIFGLLTALITWSLANRREKRRLSQEYRRKEWQDLELLYANSIAVIDKIAQVTKAGNDYSGIIDQMTLVSVDIPLKLSM